MTSPLSRKVGEGVILLFFRKIWGNVINLLVMTVLARLLTKEDFGLLAVSAVLLSIVNTVATGGLSDYLIFYDKPDSKQVFNSVFWLNLFLTIAVCLVIICTGPLWADFYGDGKIKPILWLLLVSFFFEMMSMVPRTILRKELQYKVIVQYSTIFMTLVSVGKLMGAFLGLGVYSLVLPQAVFSPLLAIAFCVKTGFRPARNIGMEYYKGALNYGKHLVGGKVLSRLVNQGDTLIIGKFLGLEALGVYNLAFQLANLVTTNVVLVINDVIMPVLSKVKADPDRLRRVFLDILSVLTIVSLPLITLVAVFAEPFILVFYGDKWVDAVPILQILCLFALGRAINSPSTVLYNALGRPDIGFKFALIFTPVLIACIALGSQYGLIAVAAAVSVVRFGGQVVSTSIAFRLAEIRASKFYRSLLVCVLLSLISVLLVPPLLRAGGETISNVGQLFIIPVFGYAFLLCMRLIVPGELKNGLKFMKVQKGFGSLAPYFGRLMFIKV